jgi:hypothetical protein
MRRITKWVAAAAVVVGLGATAGVASAYPPGYPGYPGPGYPGGPRSDTDYVVLVKHHHHDDWHTHGRFETYHQARRVAWELERRGDVVRVKPVYGGRPGW